MRLAILLISCAVISFGCKSPRPKGAFCSTRAAELIDVCVDIETGADLPDVPLANTDKWIHMPPETWKTIQDYIDYLETLSEATGDKYVTIERENVVHTGFVMRSLKKRVDRK